MGGMGPDPASKKGHQVVFILREMKNTPLHNTPNENKDGAISKSKWK